MMNFEKYRAIDTIQLVGLDAAVFQENEDGEYFVLYAVALKINGMIIDDEDELASLLPSFEY